MNRIKCLNIENQNINVDRLKDIINMINIESDFSLVDILEFHNILFFLDRNIDYLAYSEEFTKEVKSLLNKIVGKFFNSRRREEIFNDFRYFFLQERNLDVNEKINISWFRNDYIECFKKYRLEKRVLLQSYK